MDVKQQQLASGEQAVVLRGLAGAAARPGCKFLEVGSWCGASAAILAQVAREYGGHLFCVDWWKGNPDTELATLAASEDIFSLFWQRISSEHLNDVVIPIRGASELAAQVLRPVSFDLVFLDADHRYQAIRRDLRAYSLLVRRGGGILCGHDCEGRAEDYDLAFLEAGKHRDCHESVHCGVVCAVGEAFPEIALQHSIWSVRAARRAGWWLPTKVTFPGIPDRRQAPPPPAAVTASHNLLRYGSRVYVVPHAMTDFDVTNDEQRHLPGILSAGTLRQALALAEAVEEPLHPVLIEEDYLGFNIVRFGRQFYVLHRDIGPLDVACLSPTRAAPLQRQARLFVAKSHRGARLQAAVAVLEQRGDRLKAPRNKKSEFLSDEVAA
jgi:hypothetical protein